MYNIYTAWFDSCSFFDFDLFITRPITGARHLHGSRYDDNFKENLRCSHGWSNNNIESYTMILLILSNPKSNATRCIKHPTTALVWKSISFILFYFILFRILNPTLRDVSNIQLRLWFENLFLLFYFIFFCLFILFRFILLLYDNIIDKSGLRNLN